MMTGSPPTRVGGCELVNGVMFRKSLPHKAMRTEILSPRVLLLDDAISFEGGTTGAAKMQHLETLLDQERWFTEVLVAKILALKPDVLFLSGTASRIALEMKAPTRRETMRQPRDCTRKRASTLRVCSPTSRTGA